ncbi:hypothetical protein M9434_001853 [Picochlorum sp. BPE23]|nr:hypothetical protein M9434_001853 [Picochlorum sp. BPE23]
MDVNNIIKEGDVTEDRRVHETGPEGGIQNPSKSVDGQNHIHVKADCASAVVDDGETDILGLQAKMMEALGFVDITEDELVIDEKNSSKTSASVQYRVHTEGGIKPRSPMYEPGVPPSPCIDHSFRGPLSEDRRNRLRVFEYYTPYLQGPGYRFYPSCFRQTVPTTSSPCRDVSSHDHVRRAPKETSTPDASRKKGELKFVPNPTDMREMMEAKARVEASLAVYQKEWPPLPNSMANPTAPTHYSSVDDDQEAHESLTGIDGNYQPYCNQIITPRLNEAAYATLVELKRLQQLAESSLIHHETGQTKASLPKRYYCSLKEVSKVIRSCKLIIIAPDVRPSSTANIKPVRLLMSVIEEATKEGTPYIFALSRKGIGRVFGKDKNMSIMAIMSLDGVERECQIMIEEAQRGREIYRQSRSSLPGTI